MLKRVLITAALGCAIGLSAGIGMAADQSQDRQQVQEQEQMYGWQLMTPQERSEHRAKMRSLTSREEREAYRQEHHKKMQERAKARGVTLPDMPGPRGRGMGPRGGMGAGGGEAAGGGGGQ